jgi:hypothetical protein
MVRLGESPLASVLPADCRRAALWLGGDQGHVQSGTLPGIIQRESFRSYLLNTSYGFVKPVTVVLVPDWQVIESFSDSPGPPQPLWQEYKYAPALFPTGNE